jgi:hypothetical protein
MGDGLGRPMQALLLSRAAAGAERWPPAAIGSPKRLQVWYARVHASLQASN